MNNQQPVSFKNSSLSYIAPSWDKLNQLTFNVSQKIKQNNQKFDRIVTLAKGGWPMTRSLADFLGIDDIASIGIKFYSGLNETFDKPKIYQDLPISIKDEKILLFDDVADTGGSLIFTKNHLLEQGAAEVKTACLYYKPHSKIKPDYYGAETSAWIIFPFEHFEMIKLLHQQWMEQQLSKQEIQQRFKKLNFTENHIEAALAL